MCNLQRMLTLLSNIVTFMKDTPMTTTSQKTTKQPVDVIIEILYDVENVKAFKVKAKQGKFIVMDYKDRFGKNPDTEIFWESGAIKVSSHTAEFKTVNKLVTEFIKRESK